MYSLSFLLHDPIYATSRIRNYTVFCPYCDYYKESQLFCCWYAFDLSYTLHCLKLPTNNAKLGEFRAQLTRVAQSKTTRGSIFGTIFQIEWYMEN